MTNLNINISPECVNIQSVMACVYNVVVFQLLLVSSLPNIQGEKDTKNALLETDNKSVFLIGMDDPNDKDMDYEDLSSNYQDYGDTVIKYILLLINQRTYCLS